MILKSTIESKRFGISVVRVPLSYSSCTSVTPLLDEIRDTDFDVAIARVTDRQLGNFVARSSELFDVLIADSIVDFEIVLSGLHTEIVAGDSTAIRCGEQSDRREIEELTRRAFLDHNSHYTANPRFGSEDVIAGYVEWAINELHNQDLFLVYLGDEGSVIGFVSVSFELDVATIQLNAVDPDFQRRGVYTSLLKAVLQKAVERGCISVHVATPSTNLRAVRVWSELGFRFRCLYHTVHLMR